MKTVMVCAVALVSMVGTIPDVAAASGNNTGGAVLNTYVPAPSIPLVVLAQAAVTSDERATQQPDYLLNACKEVPNNGQPLNAENGVDPAGMLSLQLGNQTGHYLDPAAEATIKVTVLQNPTHGKLLSKTAGSGRVYFMYQPESEYLGDDKAVFTAVFKGKVYKVVVNLLVEIVADHNTPQCAPAQLIKVTKPSSGYSERGRMGGA